MKIIAYENFLLRFRYSINKKRVWFKTIIVWLDLEGSSSASKSQPNCHYELYIFTNLMGTLKIESRKKMDFLL